MEAIGFFGCWRERTKFFDQEAKKRDSYLRAREEHETTTNQFATTLVILLETPILRTFMTILIDGLQE